jgi:integrase
MAWVKTRLTDDGSKRFVGCYRDPDGRQRSAGTYSSRRAAERAAHRQEVKVQDGSWHDHSRGEVTFTDYVQTVWLPSRHIEASTLAAYQSYLHKHFYPFLGAKQMGKILPSDIQRWVTTATHPNHGKGLSPRSVRKYHTMLHSVFKRAVRDRVITFNPCEDTELPKVVTKPARTLTPAEYERLVAAIPEQHRLLIEVAIGTGLRWGELIALRPRHLDLDPDAGTGRLRVEETIVEVPLRAAPNGQRMLVKPYPKDNEPRTLGLDPELVAELTTRIRDRDLGPDDLLFATRDGTPISRNTFRTRIWAPAVHAAGIDFNVRIHDLRHAHASWLLAGGSDLKSVMDRMGHNLIQTTQRYLHTLPEADQKNLDALNRIRRQAPGTVPRSG